MRRALLLLALLALCPPTAAGLPALKRPPRPVTDLRIDKSGDDAVLTWTTAPSGTYGYLVCRGLLAPEFKAQKIVALITDGSQTWTDTGALTRTVQGVYINEFYMVYALGWPSRTALRPLSVQPEYRGRPRDAQQIVRFDVTNGPQYPGLPVAHVLEDGEAGLTPATVAGASSYLIDLQNRPAMGDAAGKPTWINAGRQEQYPATVDHSATMAGILFTPAGGNETVASTTARPIPTPAIGSRTGDDQLVTWTWPIEDTAGSVAAVELWRSYEGVGNGEDAHRVGVYPPSILQATDDLGPVTAGWYVFYALRLVYVDGTVSPFGPSSAPVLR